MARRVEGGSVLGGLESRREEGFVGYKPELLLIKAGVYFPHVLCRVQRHHFEQNPGYFLVCSTLWTTYADRDGFVEKSTSGTGLAPRLLVKLGVPSGRFRG